MIHIPTISHIPNIRSPGLIGALDVGQQRIELPDARGVELRRGRDAVDPRGPALRQHVEALVPGPGLGPQLHLLVASGGSGGKVIRS